MEKKSFLLFRDSLNVLDELTDEQAGRLFKAIRNYQEGKDVDLDFGLKMAFLPFKNQFKRDKEKYLNVIDRNQKNGAKGGRPRKNPNNPVGLIKTQANPSKPKKADSVSVSVSVNDSDKVKDSTKVNKTKKTAPKINYYRVIKHLKITVEEKDKLLELKYSITQIDEILDSIENYKKNTNYTNLFLTAKKWLKKENEFKKTDSFKSNNPNEAYKIEKPDYGNVGSGGLIKVR